MFGRLSTSSCNLQDACGIHKSHYALSNGLAKVLALHDDVQLSDPIALVGNANAKKTQMRMQHWTYSSASSRRYGA